MTISARVEFEIDPTSGRSVTRVPADAMVFETSPAAAEVLAGKVRAVGLGEASAGDMADHGSGPTEEGPTPARGSEPVAEPRVEKQRADEKGQRLAVGAPPRLMSR
jgi:hypothetical protein